MAALQELWAGRIYGTNTGKIFLSLQGTEGAGRLNGTLKVADDQWGLSEYTISAEFGDGLLKMEGVPAAAVEGIAQGKIQAAGRLQSDGHFTGEWSSEIGTAGAFDLFPHKGASDGDSGPTDRGPEQLYTTTRDMGVLRLFRTDLNEMLEVLKRKFPESRVVVTHFHRGAQLSRFSDEFEAASEHLDRLEWIKLNVQAPAGGQLVKSITIDLGALFNRVIVQGPDESWVLGEAEATNAMLKARERRLSTAIGRYRVNINQLIALGALIAMPELPLEKRAVFMIGTVLLIWAANKVTQNSVPNFLLEFGSKRPGLASRAWPSALSWLISATAGAAASALYALLKSLSG